MKNLIYHTFRALRRAGELATTATLAVILAMQPAALTTAAAQTTAQTTQTTEADASIQIAQNAESTGAGSSESESESESESAAASGLGASDASAESTSGAGDETPATAETGELEADEVAAPAAAAGAEFTIVDIRIDGLRRFSPGVIFVRLPVGIGDAFTIEQSETIISDLYETGFFRSVEVLREGDILVIRVAENPTIAEVTVAGASELSDEAVNDLLAQAQIAQSRVFNQSVIDEAVRVIEGAYVERNFFHVQVTAVTSPLPRNRVALLISVDEGDEAAIRSIKITGNEEFSSWTLDRDMRLEARGVLNFLTDNYKYTPDKLQSDIGRIRTRYLEAGFLRFQAEPQVEISVDKESIDIVVRITEGPRFIISNISYQYVGGAPDPAPMTDEDFDNFVQQSPGDIYSGKDSGETVDNITQLFKAQGYAYAQVAFDPVINDENGDVALVYRITPGEVIYVRQINIVGNNITANEVIRRELLQFERERYSGIKISRSRSRIRRLGYFNRVEISEQAVEGAPTEVDLLIEVEELNTGEVRLGAGFNGDTGVSFNAGFSNSNIFGSGNDFSADFSTGDDDKQFSFNLDEHYYTTEGVSRHIGLDYGETDAGDDTSAYSIDGYKGEYGFEFPFTDDGKYNLYLAYQQVNIDESDNNDTYDEFIAEHSDSFDTLLLESGMTYDTRNNFSTPNSGIRIRLTGEAAVPLLELRYYRLNYTHDFYQEWDFLPTDPTFHARFGYGYGDSYGSGVFPFYYRYLLGGANNLRGFDSSSIGGSVDDSNDAIGGKSRMYLNLEWSTRATFFENQQIYLVPFFDTGAVGEDFGLGSFRASTGVELRWLSPLGPLRFSYVEALRHTDADDLANFQFSVSTF